MTRRKWLVLACTFLLFASARSYAGGPLLVRSPGVPFLWPNGGRNIPFNPDQGGLGPLNNAEAVAQTAGSFQVWADISSASATHMNAGPLPVDVDETNFVPFFAPTAPDGLSAIVYDVDGAIFEALFGADSGVLGFAGPEWLDAERGTIVEGVAFMNGGALLGPDAFPIDEFVSVQVHEFGHYQNLAHTVVNGQIGGFGDHRGPSPFNTFPAVSLLNRIETMYPFLLVGGGMATPHKDDVAIFSTLYPEAGFAASTGRISGRILGPNNTARLTGVNVLARNTVNPYDDAVSAISSDFTDDFGIGQPLVGAYTLRGLTPGASYAVYVDGILAGGFSTPPRVLPGPEEFYNGGGESNDIVVDVPSVFSPVVAVAGNTVRGIDVIFNRLPPGAVPIGEDASVEIFPFFLLTFCGQQYESLFVNSNGNVTFGDGDAAFLESAAGHLTGPPRIAALWDDLSPNLGGSVSYSESSDSMTVSFVNVPEFAGTTGTGSNTFSITVGAARRRGHGRDDRRGHDDGDDGRITVDYGELTATDGLAGYSCGERIASGFEMEQDLSALRSRTISSHRPAIFEVFTALDNDLDNRTFNFEGPGAFEDVFEPNDSLSSGGRGRDDEGDRNSYRDGGNRERGRTVTLPFSTVDDFSAISPLGNDVDFYRFRARAGDIVVIETVPGSQIDTVVGLFDSRGMLLAADDDGGFGLLSRIAFRVGANGTYAAAVSTFPDLGFTGAGGDFGRYVLQINTYRGTILPVPDDGSIEVPIATFMFPFQGQRWDSVFVNGNGNLTFGAGSTDFSETVPELLAGPPRIAPLWDDLSPSDFFTGVPLGLVIAEEKDRALLIHFVSVPEFATTGTNYFTVALQRDGDVSIEWQATNRSDALVGLTQGGGAADPGPTDLLNDFRLSAEGTTYETFSGSFATYGGVDLSFTTRKFKKH